MSAFAEINAATYTVAADGTGTHLTLEALRTAGITWADGDIVVIKNDDDTLTQQINFGNANVLIAGSGNISPNGSGTNRFAETGVTASTFHIFADNGETLEFSGFGGVGTSLGGNGEGGALYGGANTTITLGHTGSDGTLIFSDNVANVRGGAVRINGDFNIRGGTNIFSNNRSTGFQGGAIAHVSQGVVSITGGNNTFTGNTAATWGGAIYSSGNVSITGGTNTFLNNHAGTLGGAAWVQRDGTFIAKDGDMTFQGNTHGATPTPNAIYMDNIASNNTLNLAAEAGKSIFFYDPIANDSSRPNLTIGINQTNAGGTIGAYTGTVLFDQYHSQVYGNTTVHGGTMELKGGAVYGAANNVGSFTLGPGATLKSDGGNNRVQANQISLAGSTVSFDKLTLAAATRLGIDGATFSVQNPVSSLLTLDEGTPGSILIGTASKINIENWAVGTFDIIERTGGILQPGWFNSAVTVGGEALGDRRTAALSLTNSNSVLTVTTADGFNAERTWTGAIDSNWDDVTANWLEGDKRFKDGDRVLFNDLSGAPLVNVTQNVIVGDMIVSGSSSHTFSGSGITADAMASTLTAATGKLVKNGSGALTFNNANDFHGGTDLNAGRINVGNNFALGTQEVRMQGGATLGFGGNYSIGNRIVSVNDHATIDDGNNDVMIAGELAGSIPAAYFRKDGSGTVILTADSPNSGRMGVINGTLQIGNGGNAGSLGGQIGMANNTDLVIFRNDNPTISNTLSGGSGGLIAFRGTGNADQSRYYFTANDAAYDGSYVVRSGALLAMNSATNAASSNNIEVQNGGSLFLWQNANGYNLTLGGEGYFESTGRHGALQFSNGAELAGNVTLTADARIGVASGFGAIHGDITGGNFGIEKTGAGRLTLFGTNTYGGSTIVNAGTLAGNIANNTDLYVVSGAIYDDAGTARYVRALNGDGDVYNNGGLTAQYGTFVGNISGTGSLTKTGTGTLTLTGTNTYAGGTLVNGGTLAGNITAGTDLTIAAGATYDGSGNNRQVNLLNGDGSIITSSHNLHVQGGVFGGDITGAGTLVKEGANNLQLSCVSYHTGGTTITDGRLTFGSDYTVKNGSTLLRSGTGALSATTGVSLTLEQGATVSGVNGLFIDRGTTLTATGNVTVGAANAAVSASGLSAGVYTWNNSAFVKTAIQITGPASMTLDWGYAATSSAQFTVTTPTVSPPVIVTASGNPAITWNNITFTLDIAAGLAAGTYPVTVTASNAAGYAEHLFTLTVNKAAAPAITWPTSATPITYGQTLADATLNPDSDANGSFAWTTPGTAPTVAQSGAGFSVTYTPNDTDNYDYSTVTLTATVAVAVNRATPDGTPGVVAINAAGKTLADAALTPPAGGWFVNPFDGAAVLGTLAWDDPLTTVVTQGTTYQWTFTPTDALNYNAKNGGTVVWPMGMTGSTTAIPAMSPVGLVLLVLMLGGMVVRMRRRNKSF